MTKTKSKKSLDIKKIANNENVIFALFTFVFILLIVYINKDVAGPMIQADEGSYLANAAALSGYINDAYSSYKTGYSIVLMPAFLLGDSAEQVWFIVKLINAILLGLVFILTYLLLSEVQSKITSSYQRIFISFIIACYPMHLTMSGYSFSENLFTPVFLLSTLLLIKALKTNGLYWLFLGISIGLLYWIHTKAIVVVIALAIVLLAYIIQTKKVKAPIQTVVAFSFMFLIYKYFINPYLFEQMNISGIDPRLHYPSVTSMLMSLLSLDGLQNFIVRLSGHLFYITIGTLGLIWIGLLNLGMNIRKDDSQKSIIDLEKDVILFLTIFLFLSFVGTLFISSLMFASSGHAIRLDHFMYGRYVEGVIAPILAIALLSSSFKVMRSSIFILGLLFVSFIFSVGVEEYIHTARFNIASFWQDFFIRDSGIGGWFVSGILLILFLSFFKNNIARILILLYFLFCNYYHVSWHNAASANTEKRTTKIVNAVRLDSKNKKIYFDQNSLNDYNKIVLFTDLTFKLYDFALERSTFDKWLRMVTNAPFVTFNQKLAHYNGVFVLANGWNGSIVLKKGKKEVEYPISINQENKAVLSLLLEGWHTVEKKHVWSKDKAILELPVPKSCTLNDKFELLFGTFNATKQNKKRVKIINNDNVVLFDKDIIKNDIKKAIIPIQCDDKNNIFTIIINKAESPILLRLSKDKRELGIALKEINIIKGKE